MKPAKILIPAIVGTSAMTIFSYLVSRAENKNFREPEILGQLIERLPINCSRECAQFAGWNGHLAAGIAFEVVYHQIWKRKLVKPSLVSGALLGGASGLAGIAAWKVAFEAHPNPPVKNLNKFFGHLMLAHVVFGASSALSYKLLDSDKKG